MTDDTERWLQFIAAVTYLAELERQGFTIADAIEDALRAWTDRYLEPAGGDELQPFEPPWNDPDPLRSTVERVLQAVPPAGGLDGVALTGVLVAAIEQWTRRWSDRVNEGQSFALHSTWSFPSAVGV